MFAQISLWVIGLMRSVFGLSPGSGGSTFNGTLTMASGKQIKADPGTAALPGYAFTGASNGGTGVWSRGASILDLSAGGAALMELASTKIEILNGTRIAWAQSGQVIGGATPDAGIQKIAPSVIGPTQGDNTTAGWIQNSAGESRVTTSNVTTVSITPANITGLSATVIASRKYRGELVVYCSEATAADGLRIDFDGGAATMTSFIAQGSVQDDTSVRGMGANGRTTAIATDFVETTITGNTIMRLTFAFVVNAAGTFIPRVAKEADAAGATLTVTVGSYMTLEDQP